MSNQLAGKVEYLAPSLTLGAMSFYYPTNLRVHLIQSAVVQFGEEIIDPCNDNTFLGDNNDLVGLKAERDGVEVIIFFTKKTNANAPAGAIQAYGEENNEFEPDADGVYTLTLYQAQPPKAATPAPEQKTAVVHVEAKPNSKIYLLGFGWKDVQADKTVTFTYEIPPEVEEEEPEPFTVTVDPRKGHGVFFENFGQLLILRHAPQG